MAQLKDLIVNGTARIVGTIYGNLTGTASKASTVANNLSTGANITISSSDPSGGSSGDIWFKYNE